MERSFDEFSWLVGLLDAHGGFGVQTNGAKKYAKFQLGSTNEELIEKVAGLLSAKKGLWGLTQTRKEFWTVRLTGKKAIALGTLIYPYVTGDTKTQISEMLEGITSNPLV